MLELKAGGRCWGYFSYLFKFFSTRAADRNTFKGFNCQEILVFLQEVAENLVSVKLVFQLISLYLCLIFISSCGHQGAPSTHNVLVLFDPFVKKQAVSSDLRISILRDIVTVRQTRSHSRFHSEENNSNLFKMFQWRVFFLFVSRIWRSCTPQNELAGLD